MYIFDKNNQKQHEIRSKRKQQKLRLLSSRDQQPFSYRNLLDNLLRTAVNGRIQPKTTEVGSKMLYFCSGTKLSAEYCKVNNLYDKEENNLDTTKRGFISSRQSRVKAIKLKGVISGFGMLMPLSSLSSMNLPCQLKLWKQVYEFTNIDGVFLFVKSIQCLIKENNQGGQKLQKQTN